MTPESGIITSLIIDSIPTTLSVIGEQEKSSDI